MQGNGNQLCQFSESISIRKSTSTSKPGSMSTSSKFLGNQNFGKIPKSSAISVQKLRQQPNQRCGAWCNLSPKTVNYQCFVDWAKPQCSCSQETVQTSASAFRRHCPHCWALPMPPQPTVAGMLFVQRSDSAKMSEVH